PQIDETLQDLQAFANLQTATALTPCSFQISPGFAVVGASGGGGTINVRELNGCSWTASTGADWLIIPSNSSGNGSGAVSYSVANDATNSARDAIVIIGDQIFHILQVPNAGGGPGPATPTCTWAPPSAITYGTALSSTQLDASCSVSGTYVYTPVVGTVLSAGTQTLSVTFTPTDTIDYATATDTVPVMVNQATPALAWPTPAPITYPTALSSTQLDAMAPVPGDFSYTPAVGTVLAAGDQTLSVTFTPTDAIDYTTAMASVPLTVTLATSALQFMPVTPCRVVDTRNPDGPFGGPELGAAASREFDIPQSACNIPSTAVAYSLNVTVVPNASLNYLTLWPSGQPQPFVSTLNSDGRVKANAAITPAGSDGGVSV
ncbi:MAG TPA: hypothetical protein VE178_17270, partial [Silvibacterium sp.]|nr:hypothetical protein [Silvibacterium sp.]